MDTVKNVVKTKKFAYLTMIIVVVAWGYEYVAAKAALTAIAPLALVCVKYSLGIIVLLTVKSIVDRRFFFGRRDIPLLLVCAVFGDIIYFACEYGAMSYLPVSVISIVLAFVPAVSVLLEYILWKRRANMRIGLGIAVGIVGVALVIGGDFSAFLSGSAAGYLLVFGAVFAWNIYNFSTVKLTGSYHPLDLTLYQSVCAALLSLPFLLHSLPPAELFFSEEVFAGVLYLGLFSEGCGFLIYVNALRAIGPTPISLYSNMLPVSTTFFGWLLLGEHIGPIQIAGGAVVVAAGVMVIWEKDKLDTIRESGGG
ncbi:MAG: DMT family transporter [Clostridiales Family XIII bacterium]|jgi:drug/metabolite transporter (DMT)-like permease|nr:DMT family transporter [Clostridiales Family XIII bacterium]